jgi:glucose-6-phosphate-specific signal transduction histidine kinase
MGWTRERPPGASFPWYRSHSRAALVMACALFVGITAARFFTDGSGEAVDILYSLPIALLAMSFGLSGGLIGAAIGFSLFAIVELVDGVGDIDATGWIVRAAGLLLLGVLLGRATDQIEAGQFRTMAVQEQRRFLQETARRQAEALEISDSILQHLAAAKWMVESGRDEEAIEMLTSTMATGERMVADMLPIRHGASTPGPPRTSPQGDANGDR